MYNTWIKFCILIFTLKPKPFLVLSNNHSWAISCMCFSFSHFAHPSLVGWMFTKATWNEEFKMQTTPFFRITLKCKHRVHFKFKICIHYFLPTLFANMLVKNWVRITMPYYKLGRHLNSNLGVVTWINYIILSLLLLLADN